MGHGHGPESPGISGGHRAPSDPGSGQPGQLVELWCLDWGPGSKGELVKITCLRDIWSTPHALGPWPQSPGRAGLPRGATDPIESLPGQQVDHAGLRTLARIARERWSIPRALGPRSESAGSADRHRGTSNPGQNRPGQLINTKSHRTLAQITPDSWSIRGPLDSGPGARDSWSTRGSLGKGLCRPG